MNIKKTIYLSLIHISGLISQRLAGSVKSLEATDYAPEMIAEARTVSYTHLPHPWLERCFLIAGAGNLERLEIYQKGLCYVQDAASRLAVQCAGVKPGMQVLDSCAAPGGKSLSLIHI